MSQNPTIKDAGFNQNNERPAIAHDVNSQMNDLPQNISQMMILPRLDVANSTVRLWGGGVRLKNGAGIFFAPPANQSPKVNADYLRMFTDSSFTGNTQLGFGVIALPMSSQLFFNDTGELPAFGHVILRLVGPKAAGTNNTVSPRNIGIADFSSVIYLLTAGNTIESSALFNVKGAFYYNTVSNTIRWYNGTLWQSLGAGGSSSQPKLSFATVNVTTTSTISYPHGFSGTPKLIRIQANIANEFSDGQYDGTSEGGVAWGANQAQSIGVSVFLTTSGGNIALGTVTAVTATNVTINWSGKIGSPTGIANLIITAS